MPSSRNALIATAFRTRDWGYLTRRLVKAGQNLIVTEENCDTENGLTLRAASGNDNALQSLGESALGRIVAEDVTYPNTKDVLFPKGYLIALSDSDKINDLNVESIKVRSAINCETNDGVCSLCYGNDIARGHKVEVGEGVGVVAAQSIGEPGTQLNLHEKHGVGKTSAHENISSSYKRVDLSLIHI